MAGTAKKPVERTVKVKGAVRAGGERAVSRTAKRTVHVEGILRACGERAAKMPVDPPAILDGAQAVTV